MVGTSSGRLNHIGRLDFSGGWGESQYRRLQEFRLASCTENRSRCRHLSADN